MAVSQLEEMFAIQIVAAGLTLPLREFRFCPPRRWRWDFCWPDIKLAVEVQGGTWAARSIHGRGDRIGGQYEKLNEAALKGWAVLQVTGAMVKDGRALALIQRALCENRIGCPASEGEL